MYKHSKFMMHHLRTVMQVYLSKLMSCNEQRESENLPFSNPDITTTLPIKMHRLC